MHFYVNSKRERGAYIYQWSPPSVRVERIFTMLYSKCECGAYIYQVVLQVCVLSVYLPCCSPSVRVERIFTILSSKCECGA